MGSGGPSPGVGRPLSQIPKFLHEARAGLTRLPRPQPIGFGVLALLPVLLVVSNITERWPVFLLFCLLLAALLLSFIWPILSLRGLTVERVVPPTARAHESFTVSAVISATGRRADAFGVTLRDGPHGPYERPGHALALRIARDLPARVRYTVRVKQRGLIAIDEVELSCRFPFGMFEHRVRQQVESEVLVYPRIGAFKGDPLPGSRFSRLMTSTETVNDKGQEEFRNLREYRPGDNPRLIAWKATAKRQELMVKELEDDLTKRVSIFLETRLEPGSRKLTRLRMERTISFAATLIERLARRRCFIGLYLFVPEPVLLTGGRGGRHLDQIMKGLALLEPSSSGGIQDLVAMAPEEAFRTSLPVLLMPKLDDERLRLALRQMPGRRPPVVFHTDGAWERSVFGYRNDPFREFGQGDGL
jgi:uncharacterized protein (DUF58 family)